MKAQTPAEGISKRGDWGDSRSYQVTCECGSDDHAHNVWVEADESGITVNTYTNQKTDFWSKTRWYHIWKLITTGYVEYEASIIMTQQQAFNYAETLKSAIKDVDTFRKANHGN
jgi:hypothetical protein